MVVNFCLFAAHVNYIPHHRIHTPLTATIELGLAEGPLHVRKYAFGRTYARD